MPITMNRAARWAAAALALAALVAVPDPLAGQYFGRNKVQYRTFDFRILKTPHFDVYYYPEEEVAARDAARMAERWYDRLRVVLDHEFEERQPLILYANHPHFQQTTTLSGEIDESTGGVTEAFKQRVILPLAGAYAETDHVVGHELVHAFQYDISGVGRAGGGLEQALRSTATPLWFTEGMAEYLSIGPVSSHSAMWLRDAALSGDVPSMEDLTRDPNYFPYRWGHAFWAYVGGRWGDAAIGQILKQVGQGVPYPEAFARILNMPLDEIGEEWATAIRRTYLPLLADRREAREIARPLITNRKAGGRLNLAPVISPDGSKVAFLSELDFLEVELYVADARTGEVLTRLQKGSAFDPHFSSLRYVSSAGTWSPDGRRFAFTALRKAQDVIVVVNAENGRKLREYEIPGTGELSTPTWSPDGRTIVASGNHGGVTDLFAVDVESGAVRLLTRDLYADMHPAFSPDGRTIAFVTDRGPDTDLAMLRYGSYKIALYDVETGETRLVPGTDLGTHNFNPQWTSDGRGLFFISNRNGIANVYRIDLATGNQTQVTNLFTGVTGITALSPAMTVSRNGDRMVFSSYERNFGFNIYVIDEETRLAGTPVPEVLLAGDSVPLPALLPPAPRPVEAPFNRVAALIRSPEIGLPPPAADTAWPVVPYRPKLTLDYLGQPQLGVSAGSGVYGRGGLYGGIGAIFSDMLGRHTVFGTVQAQGDIEEIGFNTVYLNQRQRWNYGVSAARVPYVAGISRRSGFDQSTNELRDQLLLFRYFDNRVGALAQYPFSRVQRVQVSAGFRRISQDIQIREYFCPADPNTNNCAGPVRFRQEEENGDAYNLGEASVALIYDSSLQGFTSPFAGQRYHFEVSPTVGTGQFVEAIADYRRYFFLRPVTVAVRGLHFGRYGKDERLFGDQFLGYPFFMRGYSYDNVRDACVEEQQNADASPTECQIFDNLFGSRLAVANLEVRVPLLSSLIGQVGLSPIEGIAFVDAGVAWGQVVTDPSGTGQTIDARPVFRRGVQGDVTDRGILTSAGLGARVNLLGYAVLEAVYVNALERDRGWHWQFSLQPGF